MSGLFGVLSNNSRTSREIHDATSEGIPRFLWQVYYRGHEGS
jgi:hypothetical protein